MSIAAMFDVLKSRPDPVSKPALPALVAVVETDLTCTVSTYGWSRAPHLECIDLDCGRPGREGQLLSGDVRDALRRAAPRPAPLAATVKMSLALTGDADAPGVAGPQLPPASLQATCRVVSPAPRRTSRPWRSRSRGESRTAHSRRPRPSPCRAGGPRRADEVLAATIELLPVAPSSRHAVSVTVVVPPGSTGAGEVDLER